MNNRTGWIALALALVGLGVATPSYARYRCDNCGYVERIEVWRDQKHTSGAGAVIGAVAGGVLGSTVGKGDGRKAATVAGAVAGGVIGNNVEKRRKGKDHYEVTVRTDDGRRVTIGQGHLNGIHEGSRVIIDDGRVRPY